MNKAPSGPVESPQSAAEPPTTPADEQLEEPRPEGAEEKQAPRRPAGSSTPAAIRSTAGAPKEPAETTPEEIRARRERVKADIDAVGKSAEIHYTMEKYPDAEGRASEVFRSITEEIAIKLAEKAAARAGQAYPPEDAITTENIKRIWEQTEVCRHLHGSGRREYTESEETIIQEALTCGLQAYHDKAAAGGPAGTTTPAAEQQGRWNISERSPAPTTQPPASPEPESFDGAQIPWELKKVKQWLCWQYGERDGKKTKIPINPETSQNTPAPDAAWSYEEVCRKAAGCRGFVGLGFSLRNGIVGVDLDHILDEEGHLIPEYADLETNIIDKIASYTERSPSGTGLHILFRCDDIPQECKAGRKRKGNIEMYCEGRFFTVTGRSWKYPHELRNLSAEEYRDIYSMLFGGPAESASSTKETSLNTPAETAKERPKPTHSDDEVFYRINRIPKYKALWNGNITGYNSQSEADFALMCQLASLTDCNKEQMIRMFRQSGLGKREKAERSDYLERTADNAIAEVQAQPKEKYAGWVDEDEEPEINPEEQAAEKAGKLEKDAQYIEDLANDCGPVVYGMYQYYNMISMIYQPEIALFVSLQAIGEICGRIWEAEPIGIETEHGAKISTPATTTTDYLTVLAKTGTGKETVKTAIKTFLEHVDIPTPPQATGAGAIYVEAMKHPRISIIQDEAGRHRQSAGTGSGEPYGPRTAETLLMDVYAGRTKDVKPTIYASGKDNPNLQIIRRNALSTVLISTPETYQDALHSDDARSGYLSRYVIIHSKRGRPAKLGTPITDPEEQKRLIAERDALLTPFLEWIPYHAGMPECDTYGQLIRPYLSTAWMIGNAYDRQNTARATAEEMRNPKGKYKSTHSPTYDERRPAERVKWSPEAIQELMTIYAQNEEYIAKHPETADMLTRKMQHVMIYALRIALASSTIGKPQERPAQPPNNAGEKEEEATTGGVKEEIRQRFDRNSEIAIERAEAQLYADARTVYEVKKRADQDQENRSKAYNAMKAAKTEEERIERELEDANADEKKDKAADLKKKHAEQLKEYRAARTRYNAKIKAIEFAMRRVYENNPPVITHENVITALNIIDFAEKSSLELLIDSIPADKWYDVKEDVIRLLNEAPNKALASSVLERKLSRHGIGDRYKKLIEDLEDEGRIMRDAPARNGGYKIRIPPKKEKT